MKILTALAPFLVLPLLFLPASAQDTQPTAAPATAPAPLAQPKWVCLIKSCKLDRRGPTQEVILGDPIRYAPDPAKPPVMLPVALTSRYYRGTVLRIDETGKYPPSEDKYTLRVYEVRSTGETPFTWYVASRDFLVDFHVFTPAAGPSYLTWVRGGDIEYLQIIAPNDMLEQVVQTLSRLTPTTGTRIPVGRLISQNDLKDRGGENALYTDVHLLSFGTVNGKLTARIAGFAPNSVHTLVQENGAWKKLPE